MSDPKAVRNQEGRLYVGTRTSQTGINALTHGGGYVMTCLKSNGGKHRSNE